MEIPELIKGGMHQDDRGRLTYNNAFDASDVKRFYTIANKDLNFVRGWQGHKIERRWFSAILGAFEIKLIPIDNWEKPSNKLKSIPFTIKDDTFDVLCVPKGYISSVKAITEGAKLLVMSDYLLGEIDDEYRFDINYFNV